MIDSEHLFSILHVEFLSYMLCLILFLPLFLFASIFLTCTLTAIFISIFMVMLNGSSLWPLSCGCACLCVCSCVLIVQWSRDVWTLLWGMSKKKKTVEDTVSFSGGMSSCMFLFGAAACGSQKLAGNHMPLILGLIRRRGEEKRGCGEKEGRREGRVL